MKKLFTTACMAVVLTAASAQDDVKLTKSGMSAAMDNGLVKVAIGTDARIKNMTYKGGSNLMGSNGIYFDYTADKNRALSPSKMEVIKNTPEMCEVLYTNTDGDLQFQQGFIMRKGESGLYVYVIANGTPTSSTVKLKETRVCVRLASTFLNGYVDDSMNGKIPSNSAMATAEKSENTIQDATYRLADGSIYTKYNWANYCERDSVHGLMNTKNGVWNIPCSYEWMNGGPLKQELTVHATSKSPITIQMLQGEHLGAEAQYYQDGERKIYGPFFIYVNSGTQEEMIADAKAQAHAKRQEWPFEWFENELYPLDRSTVTGRLNITTGQPQDSIRLILAEPGTDPYLQGKGYIYWGDTDKDGNFTIRNVRKGNYTLYGYAMKGEITDELQVADIVIDGETTDLGTVKWAPATYEHKLWQIGENNRMSDGFCMSDAARAYGLWEEVPATLNYIIGESNPATDWYYAQTKNGTWTVTFDLDETYSGTAYLTASAAGATNKPKVAVAVNGGNSKTWSFGTNDAAIYRSAVLGGRHWLQTHSFPASALKKGRNTVTFTMSGISKNGGVMWDCIKLEAGKKIVPSGIMTVNSADDDAPVEIFTIGGVRIGTFRSLGDVRLDKGVYIFRQGGRSGKVSF
ncbi:MAG: hypothetical protein K2L56_06725 [Prevotella sp.]|nr:hypothetical protein [Prevotella sp.]